VAPLDLLEADDPLEAIAAGLATLRPGATLICAVPEHLEPALRGREDVELIWRRSRELIVVLRKPGTADVEALQERLERAEKVIADLQGSVSWRVTGPLRRAKSEVARRRAQAAAPQPEPAPLRVAVHDYGGKSVAIAQALAAAGQEIVDDGPADVFLIDLDPPKFGYRERIDHYKAQGAKVVMYPHGVAPAYEYDGLYEPYEEVDARLVIGPGHAEFLRRIEYPRPAYAIGWSLCEQAPFRPCEDVRHVLLAPTHPSGAGDLPDALRESNARAFAQLCDGPWRLTVRHIETIEQNGLWPVEDVTFIRGEPGISTAEIDAADVVVAGDGTFPALAIARGAPTVVIAQDFGAFYGLPGEVPPPPRLADRYRDYVRYPFDGEQGPLNDVVREAGRSEEPIAEWKRRFIGAPLDGAYLAGLIELIVRAPDGPPALDGARARVMLGFAEEMAARPELLRRVPQAPDTTLVLWAPGVSEHEARTLLERLTSGRDGLPHTLPLAAPPSRATDQALAERAEALVSEWPAAGRVGTLPRR
jgi:hypothetical protein